ncbi:MAG: poly-gamma-glutamate synthase PgsB [Acidobacteria bacterium]|nr:poly-gamma-glutamate synthase PgsB [Acidobacteriota bacterium]
MVTIWAAALLTSLLVLGAVERWRRDRAHTRVPLRIHVNGTRGKSAVTRLVAAALREAGIATLAKTTGTEARLILPDGTEEPIERRSPPSIREQLWVLRRASRIGAQAVAVECMAIDPELQRVSEHEMVRSSIGVITNVRHDHGNVMGTTIEDVASALGGTVPRRGVLVIGDPAGADILERIAASNGARVVRAWQSVPQPDSSAEPGWMRANVSTAIAVTRELGISDEVALRGMKRARPDPGAVTTALVHVGTRDRTVVDATAANDPDSLDAILGRRTTPHLFVFQHRADRPFRLRQFADAVPWRHPEDVVLLTGDRPDWQTWRRVKRGLGSRRASIIPTRRLAETVRRMLVTLPAASAVVCCGNTRGFDIDRFRATVGEA